MAALVLLFPLVRFVLIEIGLPWLVTLKKYTEVQRHRVEDWIDTRAESHGLDPDAVEAASQELVKELAYQRHRHPRSVGAPDRAPEAVNPALGPRTGRPSRPQRDTEGGESVFWRQRASGPQAG